ncbi:unnamed protein product, partial [Mesorhabditis spiculigera]
MTISTFDYFARAIIYVNGAISYLMNVILIHTILKYSKPHMGTYKYLMIIFVVFNMMYTAVHISVMPNMHVEDYGFVVFPTSWMFQGLMAPSHWGMITYCSMFCGSLVLITYHFTYRYLLICKNHLLFLYNDITYFPIHFTIWIYWTLQSSSMSEKSRRLQKELFKALIIQTIIPAIFEYSPCALTFLTPLFHIPFGRLCNYVPIAISFYPILDPICIIYFIKDYRYALLGRWLTRQQSVYENSTKQSKVRDCSVVSNQIQNSDTQQ